MEPVFFTSQTDFHEWLRQHFSTEKAILMGLYKTKSICKGITYRQALDEALCFGWIDGIRKYYDEDSYTIRFTPRKPGSIWSAINIKRMRELIAEGKVRPAGLEAFERRKADKSVIYSYENRSLGLDTAYENQIRNCQEAWDFFQKQPPSYRHTAGYWVMSAKREETREKRLATLISDSANSERIAPLRGWKGGKG